MIQAVRRRHLENGVEEREKEGTVRKGKGVMEEERAKARMGGGVVCRFVRSWGLVVGEGDQQTSIFPRLGLKLVKTPNVLNNLSWDLLRTNAVMC